jgi:hypothetical protein
MAKDARYNTIQKLIQGGLVKNLTEFFDAVDPTPLAIAIHTAPKRMSKLKTQPELFTFQDCYRIADLLGVEESKIIELVHEEWRQRKRPKKSK